MPRPKLYVETSVVSYLTARPSRDLVTAARQQLTADWWATRRGDYDLFVSPLVLDEAGAGDASAAAARAAALAGIPVAAPGTAEPDLVEALMRDVPLPAKAAADAAHIAAAAVAGAEYLLTWNFRHIANAALRDRIADVCRAAGFSPPTLCTPEDRSEGVSR